MRKIILIFIALGLTLSLASCTPERSSTDVKMQAQQEQQLAEGMAQIGIPAITNFNEAKMAKLIYELRDQENVSTYTYIVAEQTGKLIFLGRSIGFGLPYSTQFSNPQKLVARQYAKSGGEDDTLGAFKEIPMPQAEPNGLFMPESAAGTWVLLLDKEGKPRPTYLEPNIIVSLIPLH